MSAKNETGVLTFPSGQGPHSIAAARVEKGAPEAYRLVRYRSDDGASERFEFSVLDSEYEEQAGGTAPTYSQALSEGLHYLAVYSQDGPHSLELRRVEVLPHHALPVPQQEVK